MDSVTAFAMGQANRGKPLMIFDWDKAARLIRERRPKTAVAGLEGDWEWTGGTIYRDGAPVPADDTYTYLASTWATPLLNLDGEEIECFVTQPDAKGWDAKTYWPDSARAILEAA